MLFFTVFWTVVWGVYGQEGAKTTFFGVWTAV